MSCEEKNIFDPYRILKVKSSSTMQDIKASYRKLSMKFHPDKNPGNKVCEEMFKDLAKAYSFIGTEENRKKYDAGEDMEAKNPLTAALNVLVPIFVQFCLNDSNDPIKDLKDHLNQNLIKCKEAISNLKRNVKRLKKYTEKIKGDKKNILKGGILAKIDEIEKANEGNKASLNKLELCLEFVNDFEYLNDDEDSSPLNVHMGIGPNITWTNINA